MSKPRFTKSVMSTSLRSTGASPSAISGRVKARPSPLEFFRLRTLLIVDRVFRTRPQGGVHAQGFDPVVVVGGGGADSGGGCARGNLRRLHVYADAGLPRRAGCLPRSAGQGSGGPLSAHARPSGGFHSGPRPERALQDD